MLGVGDSESIGTPGAFGAVHSVYRLKNMTSAYTNYLLGKSTNLHFYYAHYDRMSISGCVTNKYNCRTLTLFFAVLKYIRKFVSLVNEGHRGESITLISSAAESHVYVVDKRDSLIYYVYPKVYGL